ncbi:cholecystokinin receptor type A-like [Mercenaria mercenaria]|uniref:cholecystokinin receptor type A-like n=1 Tax=Mercenaria mercenaria TaxID=6596 RepID=UPI00234F8152|nr:cholecystokinin receptor type A-like [Mercenaria mercenaria]
MDKEQLNTSGLREELNKNMAHTVLPVTIFIGMEQVFGFFGNILILIVYSGRYKRTNFRYFVITMATLDFTSCCTTLPGEIFSQLNWYDYKYEWICKVKSYFNVFTAWGSASILLILAIDRYRKICRPLKWQIQPAHALKLCCCALILSILVSVPVLFLWGEQEYIYENNGWNVTVSVCEKSGKYAHTIYPLVYIGSVYFIPVGSMIFVAGTLNFLTAQKFFGHKLIVAQEVKKYSSPAETSINSTLDTHVKTDSSSVEPCSATVQTNMDSSDDSDAKYDNNDHSKVIHHEKTRLKHVKQPGLYRKRKTIIMLVLTSVFVVTMAVYVILVSLVAQPGGILNEMSNSTKVIFFFFLRLYFINCVVNPILYGFMDPRFRSGLLSYVHKKHKDMWGKPNVSQSSH